VRAQFNVVSLVGGKKGVLSMFESEIIEMQGELEQHYKMFHECPEKGFHEVRTAAFIAQELKSYGLDVKTGVGLTGVVGDLDSGKQGKTLMIRADMDCLEIEEKSDVPWKSKNSGLMHGCGHDSHVTMLLGAAKILAKHKESFSGKIRFVFQPAEEGTPSDAWELLKQNGYDTSVQGGALQMIQDHVLDGVDACLVMHVQPSIPFGNVQISKKYAASSSDWFTIDIYGKGGHGAMPHKAVDPLPVAAQIINELYMVSAREIPAYETSAFTIGVCNTPSAVWNAVCNQVHLEGTYRNFNSTVREHIAARMEEIVSHIAQAGRCKGKVERHKFYTAVLNNVDYSARVADYCRNLLGAEHVDYTDVPSMTSEDCGCFLEHVPGVYFWFGIGTEKNQPPLHSPYFHLDPKVLSGGVRMHVNNALHLLDDLNHGRLK
jgi:amidohydrolase